MLLVILREKLSRFQNFSWKRLSFSDAYGRWRINDFGDTTGKYGIAVFILSSYALLFCMPSIKYLKLWRVSWFAGSTQTSVTQACVTQVCVLKRMHYLFWRLATAPGTAFCLWSTGRQSAFYREGEGNCPSWGQFQIWRQHDSDVSQEMGQL